MELVLATRNTDKIREIKSSLGGLSLNILTFQDFSNFPAPEENAATLKENALVKAKAVVSATGKLSLADDSGLEVEALNGAPGVRSSRFAGEDVSYKANNEKLLSLLKGVPDHKRRAAFRCVMAIVSPGGKEIVVEGVCPGRITIFPQGKGGFGYDPVFTPQGMDRTFAEMPLSEKNLISHRAKALAKAKQVLEELLQAKKKFLVGLTGNLGCGKTTVAKFFERWGFRVIRADEINHLILKKDEVKRKVVVTFGEDILNSKGEVSRDRLRRKVVPSEKRLSRLNKLLHPLVKEEIWSVLKSDTSRVAVVEAALIFEAGWDFFMDRTVTVYCSPDKQLERVREDTTLTLKEIHSLLRAQLPQEEKIKRADFAIPNEKSLMELEVKAREVFDKISKEIKSGS